MVTANDDGQHYYCQTCKQPEKALLDNIMYVFGVTMRLSRSLFTSNL